MSLGFYFKPTNFPPATYDEVCGGSARRAPMCLRGGHTPSDWPVEGLLAHAAGQRPNGFRVVDVWEPELYPAHAFVSV